MGTNKLFGRIKAAVISTAMIATTLVTPAITNFSFVTAAGTTIDVNHTFVTDSDEDSTTRKGNISLAGIGDATQIVMNFTTSYEGDVTIEAYGWGLTESPYWKDDSQQIKAKAADGKLTATFEIPSAIQGKVKEVGVGIWWPQDGTKFVLETVSTDASASSGNNNPGTPSKPTSENAKSGTYTFKDNKDGTADITATLSAEIDDADMDYLLTAGYDEESYYPANPEGEEYVEGESPINAHKFTFGSFGIGDLSNVTFESFTYTIQSDTEIARLLYGGGINVQQGSDADTEIVKGKDGYWYNDQGEEDMEEYGDLFKITPNNGYKAENIGSYAEIVWDVPEGVQPYVSDNDSDTVGFQFWYAEAVAEEYTELEEIHLTSAACTYTRSMTVPYNKTQSKTVGATLTSGSDTTNQTKLSLTDLKLGDRDLISAIKFNVSSTTDLHKFTCGVGISVDETNTVADEGWYQPSNIVVLDGGKNLEIMWIIPEEIRKDIYKADGEVLFGYWYGGDSEGTEISSVKLNSVDFYTYVSQEKELTVTPAEVVIEAGETQQLEVNVSGATFTSSNTNAATVDKNGLITGIAAGTSKVFVETPEGQKFEVKVTVKKAAETTTTTTAVTTTTTTVTTTTTTVSTKEPIDWDRVLYGDVNVDGKVTSPDIVALNKYLISPSENPLKNATARENANADYDDAINSSDSMKISSCVAGKIELSKLGPAEKPSNQYYS